MFISWFEVLECWWYMTTIDSTITICVPLLIIWYIIHEFSTTCMHVMFDFQDDHVLTDIDRFRNYPGFRNYDSETKIQKLFRPIQKLRFRNYFAPIQKLFSTHSETTFDQFRNYFAPIQKLFSTHSETILHRFRNYFRPIQKLFSTDSETIFDRFGN